MYRRDQFNEALVVERCAELVAIETRVSEIDALVQGAGPPARGSADLHLRRAAPDRRPLLPELWTLAGRRRSRRRGHVRVSTTATTCPRCGSAVDAGQEYCVECGLRLPASTLGPAPDRDARAARSASSGSRLLACVGACDRDRRSLPTARPPRACVTATGGSVTASRRAVEPRSLLAVWPRPADRLDDRARLDAEGRGPRRGGRPSPSGRGRAACPASACSIRPASQASVPGTG